MGINTNQNIGQMISLYKLRGPCSTSLRPWLVACTI